MSDFLSTHLTTAQLATRWGMHEITLCNWRTEGRGPKFVRLGRKVFYPLSEVLAFEAELHSNTIV